MAQIGLRLCIWFLLSLTTGLTGPSFCTKRCKDLCGMDTQGQTDSDRTFDVLWVALPTMLYFSPKA